MIQSTHDASRCPPGAGRRLVVLSLLWSLAVLVLLRVASLQLGWPQDPAKPGPRATSELQTSYSEHKLAKPVFRGSILDRNGNPLAVSIPLASLWADPGLLAGADDAARAALLGALSMRPEQLTRMLSRYRDKRFMYLRRHMKPADASRVLALNVPGVAARTEYQRFYPTAEVSAPLVGITNIDDRGQEGLELSYDKWLAGQPGVEHVVHDRKGAVIRKLAEPRIGRDGANLHLALDIPIQYASYRALQETVLDHDARSGSAVVLDLKTGGVLALASYPAPNPHRLTRENIAWLRNRATMDLVEPGSMVKPFVVATALEHGVYGHADLVDTAPGCIRVATKNICDPHDHGVLSMAEILLNSSQVGIVRIALDLESADLIDMLGRAGIGMRTNLQLPVDMPGILPRSVQSSSLRHIAMAYGYGLSGTVLQWARAYSVLANEGRLCPLSLLKPAGAARVSCRRVMRADVARSVLGMLSDVVGDTGTGTRAQIFGYRVAGKTATVRKYSREQKRYTGEEHIAAFAGIVPYSDPRIVVVVSVDEPNFYYHGGTVAAPLFARIAAFSLRRLNVPPDDMEATRVLPVIASSLDP